MPLLTDIDLVRRILDRDRDWSAYAIGDLAPGYVEHCEWRATQGPEPSLILAYRGFTPPILFAMGEPPAIRMLVDEIDAPEISLHVRPDVLAALDGAYRVVAPRQMQRMRLDPVRFAPVVPHGSLQESSQVTPLSEQQLPAIERLYDDGRRHGEGPTFFSASMLRQGTFCGIWEEDRLIAIAGTHLYSRELSICTIGNVYTRRDRRGRGLAALTTGAVVARAIDEGVRTIVLNVGVTNVGAQRVYQRLGFTSYGAFIEGEAVRVSA
jgi:GNAT superfamily N-acetyltransferase